MSIPKSPSYAAKWKTKRQTRVKPSGMTKLLEKWDTKWKNYDRKRFENLIGTGGMGLVDMQGELDGMKKAETEIAELEKANARSYDKDEKAVVKQVLDDIGEEIAYWKERKKSYVLEAANSKVAEGKLEQVADKVNEAVDKAEARAKQLATLHDALSAADKYKDRRPSPGLIEKFRAGVNDFQAMLREIEGREMKLGTAMNSIGDAHENDAGVAAAIKTLWTRRTANQKRLRELWGDHAVWKLWADKQLADAVG